MKTSKVTPSRTATSKQKKVTTKIIQLDVFRQPQQNETQKLVNTLWAAVSTSLWFHKTFTEKETQDYKELISEHFFNGKDIKKNIQRFNRAYLFSQTLCYTQAWQVYFKATGLFKHPLSKRFNRNSSLVRRSKSCA